MIEMIRAAFNSDNIVEKNRVLRKAADTIAELQGQVQGIKESDDEYIASLNTHINKRDLLIAKADAIMLKGIALAKDQKAKLDAQAKRLVELEQDKLGLEMNLLDVDCPKCGMVFDIICDECSSLHRLQERYHKEIADLKRRIAELQTVNEPVAWTYELANTYDRTTGEYGGWGDPQISFIKPNVTPGSIRNLTPLYKLSPEILTKFEEQVITEADEYIGSIDKNGSFLDRSHQSKR